LKLLSTPWKLVIFEAVLDDIAKSDADLAVELKAEILKVTYGCDNRGAKLFFSSWCTIIRLYPDVAQLKGYVEYFFKTYPDLAPTWFGNLPVIAESFVT